MIDNVFFIVLVLNTTGLFSFLAPQLGVTIGQVSIALLGMNLFYLVVRAQHSLAILLRCGAMGGWLFVLLVWPLLTLLYAPSFEIRNVGLQFYVFTLFLGAVTYTAANGLRAMHRVLYVSLVITFAGLALSMMAPQYFQAVSDLAGAAIEKEGRPFGFLMQPNSLAIAMIFMFIGWFGLWERKNPLGEVAAILALLLVELLTGSRTGVLTSMIVAALILSRRKKGLGAGGFLLKWGLIVACVVGGIIGMKNVLSKTVYWDVRTEELISRMETMLSFKLTAEGGVKEDVSVQERMLAQEVYWSLVNEKPLLGHGFGAEVYYSGAGPIFLVAHSQALSCSMEYGILYPVVFCLLMLQLYMRRSRRDVEAVFQANSIGQFVLTLLFLFPINGGMFDSRTFYVVWGMLFTAVYLPRYVFGYDEGTGRIAEVLTRRDISRRLAESRRLQKAAGSSVGAENAVVTEGGPCG